MVFVKGALLGFLVSVPPAGPAVLMVLHRALQGESWRGFLLGLGTTAANLPYIALGALGYGAVLERFPRLSAGFDLLGALVLVLIAVHQLRSPVEIGAPTGSGARNDIVTGFVLGITNPTRLFTWAMVAAIVSEPEVALDGSRLAAWTLAVAVGQVAWWATLLTAWRQWGHRVSAGVRSRVMQGIAAGALLLAAGLVLRAIRTVAA
jgi:threonine/homoserine/homoserine lactone efflux protein